MSDNLREFDLGLKTFSEKTVPDAVRDFRDIVSMEALNGVVMLTIYDTGRARGNWQATAGAPAEGYVEDRMDKPGQATRAAGEAVIAETKDPWTPVWLHNGVPYIEVLNDGTETRPAYHMLEQTVDRLRRRFG